MLIGCIYVQYNHSNVLFDDDRWIDFFFSMMIGNEDLMHFSLAILIFSVSRYCEAMEFSISNNSAYPAKIFPVGKSAETDSTISVRCDFNVISYNEKVQRYQDNT